RFWEGWNESCVRPPFASIELERVALGAKASETISSSRTIIRGRVEEIAVGFFTPNLRDPRSLEIYTMIFLEEMDVLKHSRVILGPADPSPNPLRSGPFFLLAPIGSARLGEMEFCA